MSIADRDRLIRSGLSVIVVPFVCIMPVFLFQWNRLANAPERWFVIVYLAYLLFAIVRLNRQAIKSGKAERLEGLPLRNRMAITAWLASLLAFVISFWAFSPWLAHVACILLLAYWGLTTLKALSTNELLVWLGLLALTLPVPVYGDRLLIQSLQEAALPWSGAILDGLQVPNLQVHQTIEFGSKFFFVSELFAGWASVYALFAVAALLAWFNRLSMIVSLVTIASATTWYTFGCVLQIVAIAAAQHWIGRDMSQGWDSLLLEIIVFVFEGFAIWCTSLIAQTIFAPVPPAAPEATFLFRFVNHILSWPYPDPFRDTILIDSPIEGSSVNQIATFQPSILIQYRAVSALLVVWILLGIFSSTALLRSGILEVIAQPFGFGRTHLNMAISQMRMPTEVLDWKLSGYHLETLSQHNWEGQYSHNWRYRNGDQQFICRIDVPYLGSKPLHSSIDRSSWRELTAKTISDKDDPFSSVTLQNDLGLRTQILFSLIEKKRGHYAPKNSVTHEATYMPACITVEEPLDPFTARICLIADSDDSNSFAGDLQECFVALRKACIMQVQTFK